ncbi:MAG: hypothetical protein JW884_11730 [Deltaproteobacteria bacterium]|nr:hypothetical protein [Deltaproteobacteria bacterium]
MAFARMPDMQRFSDIIPVAGRESDNLGMAGSFIQIAEGLFPKIIVLLKASVVQVIGLMESMIR